MRRHDVPEQDVVLDPELKDGDGIPAPKIIYRMSENSYRLLRFHQPDIRIAEGSENSILQWFQRFWRK
jgi:hypothetical protein